MTDPTYHNADEQQVAASRMIADMLAEFMRAARKVSERWVIEGQQGQPPDWWLIMAVLHCVEGIRQQQGGAVTQEYADQLRLITDTAAAGNPLFVTTSKANHAGTGTVQ